MTDEELRDSLTWLYDNREELKLSDGTVKTIESLLSWLLYDDIIKRVAKVWNEAKEGEHNERETDNANT